ncbi:hypothetical protein TYRP_019740 [Tyrophagus putrescentiae]|nr:hypothetical protein TYRP_019740 [Tyrophagus putrescentiae]
MDSFGSYDEPPPPPTPETNGKQPNSNASSSSSSLQSKFLTGTSNLASYKPAQMANSGVDFQLGIKSAVSGTAPSTTTSTSGSETLESLPDSANLNHIVPAGQADTVSFSKSSTASDLLF